MSRPVRIAALVVIGIVFVLGLVNIIDGRWGPGVFLVWLAGVALVVYARAR